MILLTARLRRQNGLRGSSGYWYSADGKWVFKRPTAPAPPEQAMLGKTLPKRDWKVSAFLYDPDRVTFLKANGLWNTKFPSRRAAIAALELALSESKAAQ